MASISARTPALPATVSVEASLQPKSTYANNINLSVPELSLCSGVCRAWKRFSDQTLEQWLTDEMQDHKSLGFYESVMKEAGRLAPSPLPSAKREVREPIPIRNVRDFKQRLAVIMRSAPQLKIFTDFAHVVLIIRSTSIHEIDGRKWLVFRSHHTSSFKTIENFLYRLADNKQVALGIETELAGKAGRPVSGYVFGLEDPLPRNLTWALWCHFEFLSWLSITENGTLSAIKESEEITTYLNDQLCFPFEHMMTPSFLESLTASVRKKIDLFIFDDPVTHSLFQSYATHFNNKTMTPEINNDLRLQLFVKRRSELLSLLITIGNDFCRQLVDQRKLTAEIEAQVKGYFSSPPGITRGELWDMVKEEVVLKLRNKAWVGNIHAALHHIPKEVPHILFGGAYHITSVLRQI